MAVKDVFNHLGLILTLLPILASLVATTLTVTTETAFADGGSSSNGGGGEARDPNVVPVGLGKLLAASNPITYFEQIRDFKNSHPHIPMQHCSNSKLEFPQVPEKFQAAFDFQMELESTAEFPNGSCPATQPTSNKRIILPLSLEEICRNEQTAASYGSFLIELYQLSNQRIAVELIERTRSLGGRIPIVFTDRHHHPKMKEGTDEFTWFDPKTRRIFWSPRLERNTWYLLTERSTENFVLHEISHLYLARALGDQYPNEKTWHEPELAHQSFPQVTWKKVHTSEQAAMIESVANTLEGAGSNHPFVPLAMGHGLTLDFVKPNSGKQELCFGSIVEPSNSRSRFKVGHPPRNNEAYVGSALRMLITEDYEVGSEGGAPGIASRGSEAKKLNLLRAFHIHRPQNLRELALAYDQVSKSDIGSRWYREFFWEDPATRKPVFRPSDFVQDSCVELTPERERTLFTPLLTKARQALRELSLDRYASVRPYEDFKAEVNEQADELENIRGTLEQGISSAKRERIAALARSYSIVCQDDSKSFPARDEVVRKIYRKNVNQPLGTTRLFSTSEIEWVIQSECANRPVSARRDPDQYWKEFQTAAAGIRDFRARLLRFQSASPSHSEYVELIREWRRIREEPNFPRHWIEFYAAMAELKPESLP